MNPNLNRQRSPIQKNPPLPNTKTLTYNLNNYNKIISQKNQVVSSADNSTNTDQPSSEPSLVKESEGNGNNNTNFYKNKKQQPTNLKVQPNLTFLKNSNSEKSISFKNQKKFDSFQNRSPQKFEEYFGFKNYIQKKTRNQHKIHSQSNDSQMSHNSSQSNSHENGKHLKFISKKLEKNHFQQPIIKLDRFQQQKEERERKHSTLYNQGKNQLNKKFSVQNFAVKNQVHIPSYTPRKQSPVHHICPSPPQRQQTNQTGNQQIYKRSSLSPQNKLTGNKPHQDQYGMRNPTPSKNSNYQTVQKQPIEKNVYETQKNHKMVNYYPTLNKNKRSANESINFSFSKQRSAKNHTQSSPTVNPQLSPRGFLSLPIVTVYPFSYNTTHPTSFIILQRLAQNKSSSIFKCLHPPSGMIYCLKKCEVNMHNRDQLITQHKVSTFLEHPNIVRTYASFYDRNNLYLIMEYMDGRSLINRNQNQPFVPKNIKDYQEQSFANSKNSQNVKINKRLSFNDPHRIRETYSQKNLQKQRYSNLHTFHLNIMQKNKNKLDRLYYIKNVLEQILEGLQYIHENNIVHRDLKPDNIFVSHELCFKIGDFGSCSYTGSQQYIGTLDYAAPEIMQKLKYDKSIDLWSVGCIAYELDVGRPPFYHQDPKQTVERIINVQYNSSCISDPNLKKFIGKLLVKNGQGRMPVQQALLLIQLIQFGSQSTTNPNVQFFNTEYTPPAQSSYYTTTIPSPSNTNTNSFPQQNQQYFESSYFSNPTPSNSTPNTPNSNPTSNNMISYPGTARQRIYK